MNILFYGDTQLQNYLQSRKHAAFVKKKNFSNEVQRILIYREKCSVASLSSIITIQITSRLGRHHQSRICYNSNSTYHCRVLRLYITM